MWLTRVNQFVDEGFGYSFYVIDLGDGTAAIVDPPRFPTAHVDVSGKVEHHSDYHTKVTLL